ncbi:hypothetical protein M0657_012303 [Pyricularia oryzae]|uniref:Uncharacterized protein n=2 Tax=Pyricularia oryzae TaxID=318829 RepID=A0AA97NYM7_PYRO3|nr:hypothetical protein OOU_Y34scaffold00526g1 [Pyricularia oryzae Y34]KAI7908408.1 hypothetical protein M0657_012303 [Pyricularia oryzae]
MHHIWAKNWAKNAWFKKPPAALTAVFRRYNYYFENEFENYFGGNLMGKDKGVNLHNEKPQQQN